jgi:hypothetical protein
MDFIEQWFGVSPDHGDGTLEILWVAAAVVVVVAICNRRRIVAFLSRRRA